jgi:Tol biopolymer transport system component
MYANKKIQPESHTFFPTRSVVLLLTGIFGVTVLTGCPSSSSPPPPAAVSPPAAVNTNYVVFMADKETAVQVELYRYSLQSGTASKVNTALLPGRDVASFAISPNRLWIAYIANQEASGEYHLYVRDAALASAPVKLSTALLNGDGVSSLSADKPVWAPDSSRIAFRNDAQVDDRFELSTVAPTGGPAAIVSDITIANRDVQAGSVAWAPDSTRVAYLADQDGDEIVELYTSPGNTAVGNAKVNGIMQVNGDVADYKWAPNSSRLAYLADHAADEDFELHTGTPVGGGDIAVGGVAAGADVSAYVWAPDSSRLAYIADKNTDEVFEAFTVLPTSAISILISAGVTGTEDVVGTPSWAPNSSRVAFLGDLNVDGVFELFTSTPTGNETVRVNSTPLLGGSVTTGPAQSTPPAWSPDSALIAYVAEQVTAGVAEVFVGNPDGTGNIKISGALVPNGNASLGVAGEVWSPNGARVQYRADQLVDGTNELFTSTTNGGANNRITNPPIVPAGLDSFGKWAPDSANLAYASQEVTADKTELFMSSTDGSSKQNISGPMVGEVDLTTSTFAWAP